MYYAWWNFNGYHVFIEDPSTCIDSLADCIDYVDQCDTNPEVLQNCPETCGVCKSKLKFQALWWINTMIYVYTYPIIHPLLSFRLFFRKLRADIQHSCLWTCRRARGAPFSLLQRWEGVKFMMGFLNFMNGILEFHECNEN